MSAYIATRQADTVTVWPARTVQTKTGVRELPEIRHQRGRDLKRRDQSRVGDLKRSFILAVQAGKFLHRPHIPMLEEDNVRKGFFERQQMEAVRERLPEPLRPVVTFAYITGWRVPSEVLTLE